MNRGELNAQIRSEMEIDPAIVSDVERYRYINRAIDDLGGLGFFEKSADLAAAANPVALPADYISALAVYRVDGTNLVPLSPVSSLMSGTGLPVAYYILGGNMHLFPFEACTVRMVYAYRPAHVVETEGAEHDTSEPGLPLDWHSLIVPFAVALCHLKSGSIARYQQYLDAYQTMKTIKVSEYLQTYNTKRRVIKQAPMDYLPEV